MVHGLSSDGQHRTDSPSYLYQYYMGATTLTEEWNADKTNSWNHAMDGHISPGASL